MTTHTTSSKKKPLTPEQIADAARLKDIWERWQDTTQYETGKRVSQEAFGRANNIGGQAAVWQYINGATALNLPAALGFANGLGCKVEDFSPTLAERLPGVTASPPWPDARFAKPAVLVTPAPGWAYTKRTPVAALQELKGGVPQYLPEKLQANWGNRPISSWLDATDEDNLTVDYLSDRVAVDVVYRRGSVALKNVSGSMLKLIMEGQEDGVTARLRAVIILGDAEYTPPPEVRVASLTWNIPIKTAPTPEAAANLIVQMEAEAAELFSQEPQD